MEFEYDPKKDQINRDKHGISFEEAKMFWQLPGVNLPSKLSTETRYLRVVFYRERFFSIIFTLREEKIRLISVRRSHVDEERFYRREMNNEKKGN